MHTGRDKGCVLITAGESPWPCALAFGVESRFVRRGTGSSELTVCAIVGEMVPIHDRSAKSGKKLSGKADLAHILDGHLHVTELGLNTK